MTKRRKLLTWQAGAALRLMRHRRRPDSRAALLPLLRPRRSSLRLRAPAPPSGVRRRPQTSARAHSPCTPPSWPPPRRLLPRPPPLRHPRPRPRAHPPQALAAPSRSAACVRRALARAWGRTRILTSRTSPCAKRAGWSACMATAPGARPRCGRMRTVRIDSAAFVPIVVRACARAAPAAARHSATDATRGTLAQASRRRWWRAATRMRMRRRRRARGAPCARRCAACGAAPRSRKTLCALARPHLQMQRRR